MIEGAVTASYEPVITLTVQGPTGASKVIEAVVDTGFNALLTVPSTLVDELGLRYAGDGTVFSWNNEVAGVDLYRITVQWDGRARNVVAVVSDSTALVGMRLLRAYDLHVECKVGGRVLIEASAA